MENEAAVSTCNVHTKYITVQKFLPLKHTCMRKVLCTILPHLKEEMDKKIHERSIHNNEG